MIKKFYNATTDVLIVINYTGPVHTTAILGDETKVTDEEIFALYTDNKADGFKATI